MDRNHLGIVAEFNNRRISLFNTNTLEVLQQLPLNADAIDVAINRECTRAFVTSFDSRTMFQIDLCETPAQVIGSAVAPSFLEDVALTPDGKFAISVDGSATNQNIVSYSSRQNAFVSILPTSAQAVAISPKNRNLVLTAQFFGNSVHRFVIQPNGVLEDTGQSFPAGVTPNNIAFSPDGEFAFVVNSTTADRVSVLSTRIPENVTLLSSVPSSDNPQSLVVTRDGRHVFVLAATNVDIFSFDPVAGSLTLERSFAHGLSISSFFGVDQIALDACETKLFISGNGRVASFTTYGLPLGDLAGVQGPGGIAICSCHFDHRARD